MPIGATLHLDRATRQAAIALAEQERRPLSQLLRNIIADGIAAKATGPEVFSKDQEAAA
jgi:hypothetical protein